MQIVQILEVKKKKKGEVGKKENDDSKNFF